MVDTLRVTSTALHLPAPATRRPAGVALALVLLVACATLAVPGVAALAAGCALGVVAPDARRVAAVGQPLLKACVAALGAGLDLGALAGTAVQGWATAAATIAIAGVTGLVLARVLRVERETALLVTVGTAICGGSAIAAAAPVLRARPASVAVALGVVFALNAIALLVFPWLGAVLELDARTFGEWCALAIHDTSSVVGAASSAGPEALAVATTAKLARALWIVPVCALLAWRTGDGAGSRPRVPGFVLLFVAMAALFTFAPLPADLGGTVAAVGRAGLGGALFAIGLAIDPRAIAASGPRQLVMGTALWLVLGVASLALVL